ncbi:MAG: phosphodiester glycosidase family protein [Clostridia bacterium]|nr:phosphodiester glycosidase family protein [Clostridia bacterium]
MKKNSTKPLDEFRRVPMRRYDLPPQEETRLSHAGRFRKRYFDLPAFNGSVDRLLMGVFCAAMVLLLCSASAPMGDVPDVQSRFEDWAAIQNEKTIKTLPGATPEPGTELYNAVNFDQQEQIEQILATPSPTPPGVTPEPTSPFKIYEPGELSYKTDKLSVSIEQKQKNGITYFVCDIKLSDVSQLRTAFAGDDFRSGIYEAVSDIAGRYSPVLAINADFCRYHREGVIIRNGEVLRRQNIKKHHLLVVDENGNLSAQTDRSGKQGLVANKLEQANTWQTFEFGPVLVEDGQAAELPLKSFYVNCNEGYYEPRTGIGQVGPLHYMVIVVDGRRDGYSKGASIPQLQELFLEEGAQFAFNLDGGGSTTLYFLGEVVNMPSGGKERSVSDVIMFMANPQ